MAVGPEDDAAGRLAAAMPGVEVRLVSGLWLRPGVYATHGHYLDLDLTVPRLESIAALGDGRSLAAGANAGPRPTTRPCWGRSTRSTSGSRRAPALRRWPGGTLSRTVSRKRATGGAAPGAARPDRALPGAIEVLNRLGLGRSTPS